MQILSTLALLLVLSCACFAGDKADSRSSTKTKHEIAILNDVQLSFIDGDKPKFVVKVSNTSESNVTLTLEPKRFHGAFRCKDKDGSTIVLYVERYWQMKGTGFWGDPVKTLAKGESMTWEVPIDSLINYRKAGQDKSISRAELSGLNVFADFEHLSIQKQDHDKSFIEASRISNTIEIP